jgi:hypothetical protein
VLDDRDRRVRKLAHELECRIGIGDVVEAQLLALDLRGGGYARSALAGHVERRPLVRILAVARQLRALGPDGQALGQELAALRREPARDRAVVRSGSPECLGREPPAQPQSGAAIVRAHRLEHMSVVLRLDHDRHARMILRGGAHHRRSADVDHLHGGLVAGALGHRGLERVQIDHDQIDRRDVERLDRRHVRLEVAARENPAVHCGVQCLDATIEDAGRPGHAGDVGHRQPGFAQGTRRAPGRDELHAHARQLAREIDQAGFIPHGQEGAPDRLIGHGRAPGGTAALVAAQPWRRKRAMGGRGRCIPPRSQIVWTGVSISTIS